MPQPLLECHRWTASTVEPLSCFSCTVELPLASLEDCTTQRSGDVAVDSGIVRHADPSSSRTLGRLSLAPGMLRV